MTAREKMIDRLWNMGASLKENGWTKEGEHKIWKQCEEWNDKHPEEEIFMCEHESEKTGHVNGFYIEDDYLIFED